MKKLLEWLKKLLGQSSSSDSSDSSSGFTLIELLVVIGILGIMAAVLIVLVDPLQQIAKTRDAGRKSNINQIGRATQAWFTTNGGTAYPTNAQWGNATTNVVVTSGEIKFFPSDPNPAGISAITCTGGVVYNSICYKTNATDFIALTHMESNAEQNKGTCAGVAANTWYAYTSINGKAGTICQVAEPVAGTSYTMY